MAPVAENVVVAGTGALSLAPSGTALPVDLDALAAPWIDTGYTSEDGVTIGMSRDEEAIMAWQSPDPVRRIVTSEPKTVGAELLEFKAENVLLALRGGELEVTGTAPDELATLTPPEQGASDVRALVVDAIDGDSAFRFAFAAVELGGDVEFALLRSNATRLPLEFGVNAGGWKIITNHPSWIAAGSALALSLPLSADSPPPKAATREVWEAFATAVGVSGAAELATKEDVIAAAEKAAAEGK